MQSRRQYIKLTASCSALGVAIKGSSPVSAQQEAGTERWSFDINQGVRSSPTVINQTTFIGGLDGYVYALNADDGTEKWRYDTGSSVFSSPMVVEDKLYIGSYSGYLHAIDISSGSEEWRFDTGDGIQASSPTYYNSVLYFGAVNSSVYAVDAASGTQRWEFATGDRVDSSPIVTDEAVYIASRDGNLYSISRTGGEEIWRFESADEILNVAPALDDGVIYAGSEDENLYAIDQQTGGEVWRFRGEPYGFIDSPTVSNGHVIIGDTSGTVYSLSPDGEERWRFVTEDLINSGPTVAENTVYIGSRDGSLYAISADDGTLEWDISLGEEIRSSPTVVDGIIYVGSQPQGLFAINSGHSESSGDSRVTMGALGHHASFSPNSRGGTTLFQQVSQRADSPLLWSLIATGSIGGAYLGYKKLYQAQDETEKASTNIEDTSTDIKHKDDELKIPSYRELQIRKTIHKTDQYIIKEAIVNNRLIWIITQNSADSETINYQTIETYSEEYQQWLGIDPHPQLLTVYECGSEPIPWAAVERADHPSIMSQVDNLTINKIIHIVRQVCEVLHHVHRYGVRYENLTPDSILYSDDLTVKIRGLLDQFGESNIWYNAPEEFDGGSTEQTVVYRIGLIAYELLTGTLPYTSYPVGDAETIVRSNEPIPLNERTKYLPEDINNILLKALSKNPSERHETLLHLRDELQNVHESIDGSMEDSR